MTLAAASAALLWSYFAYPSEPLLAIIVASLAICFPMFIGIFWWVNRLVDNANAERTGPLTRPMTEAERASMEQWWFATWVALLIVGGTGVLLIVGAVTFQPKAPAETTAGALLGVVVLFAVCLTWAFDGRGVRNDLVQGQAQIVRGVMGSNEFELKMKGVDLDGELSLAFLVANLHRVGMTDLRPGDILEVARAPKSGHFLGARIVRPPVVRSP